MACGIIDVMNPLNAAGCAAGAVAGAAADNVLGQAAEDIMKGVGNAMAAVGSMWVKFGTPQLTGGGSTASAGATPINTDVTVVLNYVMWLGYAVAVIALLALAASMAVKRQRGDALVGRAGAVLGGVILIGASSAVVSGLIGNGSFSRSGGAAQFLQQHLFWLTGIVAVFSVVVGAIQMIVTQRSEPAKDLGKSLLTLIVVAGAGTTIISLLVTFADKFAVWILDASLDCSITTDGCFGTSFGSILVMSSTSGIGLIATIVLGIITLLASCIQIIMMLARSAMLVVLTGCLPLAASFTNTETGKSWFRKYVGWLMAFLLYKPVAAIIYATAFKLVAEGGALYNATPSSGSWSESNPADGTVTQLTGLMLMVLALVALPALLRFVTPMVGAAAGAGGGAMAAGAAGAAATGAVSVGRKMFGVGSGGGGGASSGGGGGAGRGGSEASGATQTASPAQGSPAAASSSSAAAAAGSSGGAAAAGPVGAAVGAAIQAGQQIQSATTAVANEAVGGSGVGPSGAGSGGGAPSNSNSGGGSSPTGSDSGAYSGSSGGRSGGPSSPDITNSSDETMDGPDGSLY